jgi:hypothetical protein
VSFEQGSFEQVSFEQVSFLASVISTNVIVNTSFEQMPYAQILTKQM